jgi:hypothetical protein
MAKGGLICVLVQNFDVWNIGFDGGMGLQHQLISLQDYLRGDCGL